MRFLIKIVEKMKHKTKNLRNEITAVYYAYQNPKTKILPKIIIFFTLGYALSPVDLIPDFIPVLGYLDDLIIIPALITLSIKLLPDDVMAESREMALKKPLIFKNNWFFALVFILIWLTLITVIVTAIIKVYKK